MMINYRYLMAILLGWLTLSLSQAQTTEVATKTPDAPQATLIVFVPLSVSTNILWPVSCHLGNDGMVRAVAANGTPPYTYQWGTTPVQNTALVAGLAVGTYSVTVTDSLGATAVDTVTLTSPPPMVVSIVNPVNTCSNGAIGQATVQAMGSMAPYTFQWDAAAGNQTTRTAYNLASGSYNVTVTSASGCMGVATAVIGQNPSGMTLTTTGTDVSCNGGTDGTATVQVSGGAPPYAYLWGPSTGNQTGATAINLAAGCHTVLVTDMNGCADLDTVCIGEPPALNLVVTTQDVSCFGGADGSATAIVTGGTPPYSYVWPNGAITSSVTGLPAIQMVLPVFDSLGCSVSDTVVINEPPLLQATLVDHQDGTASVTPSGGTPNYQYLWSHQAQTTDTVRGLSSNTTYVVTVTDVNTCVYVDSITTGVNNRTGGSQQTRTGTSGPVITPNPAQNFVRVHWDIGKETELELRVLTATGQTLLRQANLPTTGKDSHLLDIRSLTKGIYFLEIKTATRQWTQQLVVY